MRFASKNMNLQGRNFLTIGYIDVCCFEKDFEQQEQKYVL